MEWNLRTVCELRLEKSGAALLPVAVCKDVNTVSKLQSLVGRLLWIARCTRPGIGFAVHKAPRRTHSPTVSDWKLGKRIVGYLAGTKRLRLRTRGDRERGEPIKVTAFSDADSAADTEDRKPVTGGFVTVDGMAVDWFCKKQEGSLSTVEAEYTAASGMGIDLADPELLKNMVVSSMWRWIYRLSRQSGRRTAR
ncbi:hypothetical protein PI125_g17373 [Phytophthora idaei]|nr:hypothetical protein PI125_g17373 [Phytophthora idaei]KAG3141289.1 hypothetical protein PI126_g15573 [Phytophthora idaei]